MAIGAAPVESPPPFPEPPPEPPVGTAGASVTTLGTLIVVDAEGAAVVNGTSVTELAPEKAADGVLSGSRVSGLVWPLGFRTLNMNGQY